MHPGTSTQPSLYPADIIGLLDRMVDIICLIDAKGILVFINRTGMELLGYQPEEMLGKNVIQFVKPEDKERSQEALNELPTQRDLSYFRNFMCTKNGDAIEVEWYNTWNRDRQLILSIGKNLSAHQRPEPAYHLPAAVLSGTSLADIELFKGISPEDISKLEAASAERLVKKGEALRFPQFSNKYAFLLVKGVMKTVTTHTAGQELIKFLVRPVNLVGDIPILEQYERPSNYAVALKDSTVILLDMGIIMDWFHPMNLSASG